MYVFTVLESRDWLAYNEGDRQPAGCRFLCGHVACFAKSQPRGPYSFAYTFALTFLLDASSFRFSRLPVESRHELHHPPTSNRTT